MYTCNIQKGGALLDDMRRVVEVWDSAVDAEANLRSIAEGNLLVKSSRRRSEDVLKRMVRPRIVDAGADIIPALKNLLAHPNAFTEAVYYETSRDETLLAAFAEGPLMEWHAAGRLGVEVEDVRAWIAAETAEGNARPYSDIVRTKIARGVLAALRDFNVLQGTLHKQFRVPHLSAAGYAYVAFREAQLGATARQLVAGTAWRRWLLDEPAVRRTLVDALSLSVFRVSEAGSAMRVDWIADSLEEVTRAASR